MLAAGAGTRLRPLTDRVPKALCAVGHVALVDHALARAFSVTDAVAVNAHHLHEQVVAHVGERAHVAVELPEALGTAGALGNLRGWIDGRDVLALNADAWLRPDPTREFVAAWDGDWVSLLVVNDAARPDFDDGTRYAGMCLLPWAVVERLEARRSSLYEEVWKPLEERGDLHEHVHRGEFFDCGTPGDLEAADRAAVRAKG